MALGAEPGEVCVGGIKGSHRPAVRGRQGRCFICEPLTEAELDASEESEPQECDECHHLWHPHFAGEGGCSVCSCRVGSKARIPDAVSANMVTFTMEGGMQCRLLIPTDMSMVVDGGTLVLAHNQFITGISAIVPQTEAS